MNTFGFIELLATLSNIVQEFFIHRYFGKLCSKLQCLHPINRDASCPVFSLFTHSNCFIVFWCYRKALKVFLRKKKQSDIWSILSVPLCKVFAL